MTRVPVGAPNPEPLPATILHSTEPGDLSGPLNAGYNAAHRAGRAYDSESLAAIQGGVATTSAIPLLRSEPALKKESMMIPVSSQTEDVSGPDIVINCPACGHRNAAAQTFESTEWVKLLFFIPILRLRTSAVQCLECEEMFRSRVPIAQLSGKTPSELEPLIRYHASKPGKIMSVVALLTCLVPIVGVITSAIAMVLVRGTRRWPIIITWVSMILSIVISLAVVLMMLIE